MKYRAERTKAFRDDHSPVMSTYSIVACDPASGEVGVGVQSKFLAVGALVPRVRVGAGAAASQAATNSALGGQGLALLANGEPPEEVLKRILAEDPGADRRQVGLVDAAGRSAAHTGARCLPHAGHVVGPGYACQGNCLAGPGVLEAMAGVFQKTAGDLPQRLTAALAAAEEAGGDVRGSQSAALLVAGPNENTYAGAPTVTDLRVDDHPRPVAELDRLLQLHRLYFSQNYIGRFFPFGPHLRAASAAWLKEIQPEKTIPDDPAELQRALIALAGDRGLVIDESPQPGFISGAVVHQLAEAYFDLEAARLNHRPGRSPLQRGKK